ncbi:MAG: TonB-dependent receptor, plug [Caulobacter sp.]|nr:TonB-dependent receptor, plug [Caulobacter sp.]
MINKPGARLAGLIVLAACAMAGAVQAADGVATPDGTDVNRLSLEELTDLKITSVSKREESVGEAAAAVYVIDGADIRRSAAETLPDALRLAPNLQVQQIDSANYAITARGFNSKETANKLLVMIDGRSIYTPLYSGVQWDVHDVPLGEIDRIEVISGPGGALYGANAVNGVINVVSKSAFDSQGLAVDAAFGEADGHASIRHGGLIGEAGAYRLYASGLARRSSFLPSGAETGDELEGGQLGFRTDWRLGADSLTVQGDWYSRSIEGGPVGGDFTGGNLLTRWTHAIGETNSLELQAYYDRNIRHDLSGLDSDTQTWDIALQHAFTAFEAHNVVWGAGYRFIDDEVISPPGSIAFLDPEQRDLYAASLFVQDQWRLRPDLTLTLGLKLETGTFRDIEPLPSLRLGWRVNDAAFLWAAASRAVRIPSRIDRNLTFPGFLEGGGFEREELWAYELGYRGQPTDNTTLSVSLFYNDYDDLRTADIGPGFTFPLRLSNTARGKTWGAEVWGTWDVTPMWRLGAGLFAIEKDFELKPGSRDISGIASQGDDPQFQATLRSQLDLTEAVDFDLSLRAVDDLRTTPAYVEADARLGWRLNDRVELSLGGANLLGDKHFESDNAGVRRQVGRTVHIGLRWSY